MAMKLKLDDDGHVVVEDGKPVYILEDGKEVAHDAAYTVATIQRLNNEAKGHRERAEEAENKLKAYEGIEDPDKAREALETVANLDSGALVSAGKVKEIQDAARQAAEERVLLAGKAAEQRIKDITGERDGLQSELHSEKVGGAFNRSKFITEKCSIPVDLVQHRFGNHFKVEGKDVVGYDSAGNKIYSRAKPGELAGFEEAIEIIIDAYPYKEQILAGTNNSGGGSEHATGGRPARAQKGDMGGTHKERVEALKSKYPELDKASGQ